jgi:hypothetical protein
MATLTQAQRDALNFAVEMLAEVQRERFTVEAALHLRTLRELARVDAAGDLASACQGALPLLRELETAIENPRLRKELGAVIQRFGAALDKAGLIKGETA